MAPAGTVGLELVPCNFLEFSLLEWTKAVQNAAVGQNGLHAHHGSVQVAISDEPQSPGVGGDVAADVTASATHAVLSTSMAAELGVVGVTASAVQ